MEYKKCNSQKGKERPENEIELPDFKWDSAIFDYYLDW